MITLLVIGYLTAGLARWKIAGTADGGPCDGLPWQVSIDGGTRRRGYHVASGHLGSALRGGLEGWLEPLTAERSTGVDETAGD